MNRSLLNALCAIVALVAVQRLEAQILYPKGSSSDVVAKAYIARVYDGIELSRMQLQTAMEAVVAYDKRRWQFSRDDPHLADSVAVSRRDLHDFLRAVLRTESDLDRFDSNWSRIFGPMRPTPALATATHRMLHADHTEPVASSPTR